MIKRIIFLLGSLIVFAFSPVILNADIIQLAPSDFQPQDPSAGDWHIYSSYQDYMYCNTGATYRYLFSRCLDLPHLGTLDQIRFVYYDNSSFSLRIRFIRQKISDFTETVLAEYTTSGTASFDRTEDLETFTYPTIKNKGYRYFVQLYWSGGDGSLRFKAIRVRFYPPSS